jgi:hypothetical protein
MSSNCIHAFFSSIGFKPTTLLDLGEAKVKVFFVFYNNYKNATNSKRSQRFLELLIYTYKTLGSEELTRAIIQKETKPDPMAQFLVMMMVEHHSNKK